MKFRSSLFRIIRQLQETSGNAMVVATVTVTVTALAVVGLSVIVNDSQKYARNSQNATEAHFAGESLLETAILDASGHLAGYQVEDNQVTNYNKLQFGRSGTVQWSLENRAHIVDTDNQDDVSSYGTQFDGYMVYPAPSMGTASEGEALWNTLSAGKSDEIPLFVDNTSRSMCKTRNEAGDCTEVLGQTSPL